MFNIQQAKTIVKKNIPKGKVESAIIYKNLYVFKVFTNDKFEGQMDPFYSVNIETGEFRDFSILTDGDITELIKSFTENPIRFKS